MADPQDYFVAAILADAALCRRIEQENYRCDVAKWCPRNNYSGGNGKTVRINTCGKTRQGLNPRGKEILAVRTVSGTEFARQVTEF